MSTLNPDILVTTKGSKAPLLPLEDIIGESKVLGLSVDELIAEQIGGSIEKNKYVRDNTKINIKTISPEQKSTNQQVKDILRRQFIDHPEKEHMFKIWSKAGTVNHGNNNILDYFGQMMSIFFGTLKHLHPTKADYIKQLEKQVGILKENIENVFTDDMRKNELFVSALAGYLVSIL